jgi:peptidoglycan/LPS O-acetylase OafA/YrhL
MGWLSSPDPGSAGLKSVRMLIVTLSALMLVGLGASPAFAVGAGTPKPWHYWIAPILALSFIGIFVALMVGYYVKVFRPKYRGR